MTDQPNDNQKNFVSVFNFSDDESKPGRVISSVKIGDVYMTRLTIEPGVTTGNYYHKETRLMFYVERGQVLVVCEQVHTKSRKKIIVEPAQQVIHVSEYVSLATRNIGAEEAVLVVFSNNPLRSEDNVDYKVL